MGEKRIEGKPRVDAVAGRTGSQLERRILLVDDDDEERDVAAFLLRHDGFTVVEAIDEPHALRKFRTDQPDAVVVSLELAPLGAATALVRQMRSERRTPVIVSVAGNDPPALLRCLEVGADDFITKPLAGRELALRVRSIVDRTGRAIAFESEASIVIGDLCLDPSAHVATRGGVAVQLTPTEFRICYALLKNAERVVPVSRLLALVGGTEEGASNALRSHISHLRRKLALRGLDGEITSIPAVGYVFRARGNTGAVMAGTASAEGRLAVSGL